MQRVSVRLTKELFEVSFCWPSQMVDMLINSIIAVVVVPFDIGWYIALLSRVHLAQVLAGPWMGPSGIFMFLAARNIYRSISPRYFELDKTTGNVLVRSKPIGAINEISALRLEPTGWRSPSRFALMCAFSGGRKAVIATSGYTGSRLELAQLGQMIAEFIGNPSVAPPM